MNTRHKLFLALALSIGSSLPASAQLLYQWAFTNVMDTATQSYPTHAATPGTGVLGLLNTAGDAITPGLIYFTNANSGPPGGPEGALVLNGQGYNGGNSAVATNSSLNLGTLYQFTITYWVQFGTSMATNFQLARQVQFGASVNYDEGGKGSVGNHSGVGTSINGMSTNGYTQFQDGIANASGGCNPQVTITTDPNFPNGFVCDGQTWYFVAITYDGLKTATNFTVWLASTNATTATGTPGLVPFVQTMNYGGIPFATNASVILAGCAHGGPRGMTTGKLSEVRIYNGLLTSNELWSVRWFGDVCCPSAPHRAVILSQPNSGKTFAGGSRSFSVSAGGDPAMFTYLWRSNNVVISGATNASLTLSNVSLSANGASLVCSVSNIIGGANSDPAALEVVPVASGSFAQAVLTNRPYALWLLNEPTNATSFLVYDYANGNDGQGLRPWQMRFTGGPSNPAYPGFPNHTAAIELLYDDSAGLNLPELPVYNCNGMTLCGWIYTPTNGIEGGGIIYSFTNIDTFLGSPGFGLLFGPSNQLNAQWGTTNLVASGLSIPTNEWAFVALTIGTNLTQVDRAAGIAANTNLTLYLGTVSGGGLSSFISGSAQTGDNFSSGQPRGPLPLGFWLCRWCSGRSPFWNINLRFSHVAVFYQALSPQTITNLYLAGAGLQLSAVRDPGAPASLLLKWMIGTLQEATIATGPYTEVPGSPVSPYSVPMGDAMHFYRLRH